MGDTQRNTRRLEFDAAKVIGNYFLSGLSLYLSSQTVSYEASYLPFLFSASTQSGEDSDEEVRAGDRERVEDPERVSGRRSFNGQGKEVKVRDISDLN